MDNLDIIKVFRAYFNKEKLNYCFNEEEAKVFLAKFRYQALSQFLYPVYNNSFFKNDYILSVINHEKFILLEKDIKRIFDANQLEHIFLKGSSIYKLYSDNCLRSRGDIDVLVKEADYAKAIDILSANGYVKGEMCEHHTEFVKDKLSVELHRSLFDSNEMYYEYFSKPFDNVESKDGYSYHLTSTYNLEYILCHYVYHLRVYGAGLRPVLDICLMLLHTNIDLNKLKRDLNELKLSQFYEIVINVGNYIFEDLPKVKQYDVNSFIEFTVESGIHGLSPENKDRFYKKHAGRGRVGYILSKLFPKPRVLRGMYPRCDKYPILLPLYWFKNVFRLIFKRSKVAVKVLKYDNAVKEEYNKFYRSIGL